jgi:hypothetical protein
MKQLFIALAFIGAAHAQDFPAEVVRPEVTEEMKVEALKRAFGVNETPVVQQPIPVPVEPPPPPPKVSKPPKASKDICRGKGRYWVNSRRWKCHRK